MAHSIAACSNAMWNPPMRKLSIQTSASHVSQYTFARSSTVPFQPSDVISLEESSTASTSMLVNINCKRLFSPTVGFSNAVSPVYLKNATVGRDISPNDTELLVLFRRNSKEITSHASQWKDDHSADWNETIPIQTSLLPKLHPEASVNIGSSVSLHPKEYDIVLVALPSHSAVAVFSFDFAEMVQSQIAQEIRERSYRISPLKCRDLAATLEFHIEWEFAQYVSSNVIIPAGSQTLNARSSQAVFDNEITRNGRPRNLSMQPEAAHVVDLHPRRVSSAHPPTRPIFSLSRCSEIAESCDERKVFHQRLERRNTRLVKVETELKEALKKAEMLGLATEELAVREAAESKNAARYRSVAIRMLTEMELGHCMWLQNKTHTQSTDLPAQIRYWLQELDAGSDAPSRLSGSRNSVASTASTSSSQKSSRSVLEERVIDIDQMTELLGRARHLMEQAEILTFAVDKDECSKVTSISQQLNAFEKENMELRAKLNDLQLSSKVQVDYRVCQKASRIDALEAEVEKLRIENQAYVEQVDGLSGRLYRHTETSTSFKAPSFLTKIYQDVGKAKVVLEAQLKHQKQQLVVLEAENEQLRTHLLELEPCHSLPVQDTEKSEGNTSVLDQDDEQLRRIECLQATLEEREAHIVSLDLQLNASTVSRTSEIDSLSLQLKLSRQEANELRCRSNEFERLQTQLEAIQHDKKALEMKVAADGDMQERKQNQRIEQVREEAHEESRIAHAYNQIVAEKEATITVLQQSVEALRQQQEARTTIDLNAEVHMQSLQSLHAEEVEGFKGQLADVSKQLKISRQEVMELRFRSKQLESLTCKYDLIVSEKNAFEAKLLALQGQLYDQRDRALSSDEYCCGYKSRRIHLGRMEEQLSDLQVQLGMVQERNQGQAIRIDELIIQHRRMCSEKEALNGIVDQLIAEKANFEKLLSSEQPVTRSSSQFKRSQSVSEASIPVRNVADLIRNFS
uniref:Uncharacterized protein AlNc14C103G6133 n=1 Tax=Albugo laibachii Nc14 TaxID=890382 RepID=F0WHS6_9STRA|nr:conserved hypothetical protein [Albugo laibachii Nc14]|eukprot:CCA20801.1 conserved hypothetical protein [Albugo laibachii Nc14]